MVLMDRYTLIFIDISPLVSAIIIYKVGAYYLRSKLINQLPEKYGRELYLHLHNISGSGYQQVNNDDLKR